MSESTLRGSAIPPELHTARLVLRKWREADRPAFATMNADPRVMEFFPSVLARVESDAMVARIVDHWEQHGFGLWAVEIPGVALFAGFIGLCVPRFDAPFTPCVEIGWRLAAEFWGRGYATEGARAALDFGFRDLRLNEIVSMTAATNGRSRHVMEKLGMRYRATDDFDHPFVPAGHRLQRHVLYRLSRPVQ